MAAIRNKDGIWVNTEVFREPALHFSKYGYYCTDPWGSPAWTEYWQEQLRRIIYGYESGGAMITGDHYFYLNFCPIQLTQATNKKKTRKIKDFPHFWDGDFEFFWSRAIAKNGIIESMIPPEKLHLYDNMSEEKRHKTEIMLLDSLHLTSKIDENSLKGGFNMIIGKSRRKGYQQPHSEIVMTPDGPTTMGQLKVNDFVLTPTGKAKILEKFPQGKCDVYEVTLQDGRKVKCGKEHLWNIIEFRGYTKTVNTEFFLTKKLKKGVRGKEYYSYYLPQNEEVIYDKKQELPLNPYLLGLLIGDGSINRSTCLFNTSDIEILENIRDILGEDYEINYAAGNQFRISYTKEKTKNPILDTVRNLGLNCIAKHKYIPDIYKYASVEDRYELVRGLMDTDGSITKGSCSFVNTSERLIDDLAFVLRSLGIRVKKVKNNNLGKGFSKSQAWTLIITTDKEIFKLGRKAQKIRKRCYNLNKIAVTGVKKLDYQEESSCILIDSEEHLYLTKDFIVTHNSYKNSAIGVKNYITIPNSLTIYGAYEKKYLYPKGTMTMALNYINFINDNTAWAMPSDYINRADHIKASYKEYKNGLELEKGFKSEIMALTFKDNPDAARGKDAEDIFFEEAGAFGTPELLKQSYAASEDCVKDGEIKTGMITIFGTSGDIEGGTADYAHMFFHPEKYDLLPFMNIFEQDDFGGQKIGFFHPVDWNMPGHIDASGNSNHESAKQSVFNEREYLEKKGATSTDLQRKAQEKPLKPSEAFAYTNINIFPKKELEMRKNFLIANGYDKLKAQPVTLYRDPDTKKIVSEPDLKNKLEPITSFAYDGISKEGAVVIYEYPMPNAPKGLYKIGYDPVRQDEGTSLAAIIVFKGVMQGSHTKNCVVAEYIGRKGEPDDVHNIAELLAEFYNTKIMYENEVPDVKTYFQRRRLLHLLEIQPDAVISKNVKKSKVSRVFGCHMTTQLKDAGERYIKQWLVEVIDFDENNNPITNLDKINSLRLIEELLMYNKTGNFDLISAFIMCMFQVQEEVLNKEYEQKPKNKNVEKLLEMMNDMYKK